MTPAKSVFRLAIVLLFVGGCHTNKSSPDPELATIDLLRGDIVVCGSNQFGEVSFSLSCSGSVQETFNLAVSLLHSFEYDEAEKAFVKVIDADPECAMAYWGVAMSIYHALWAPPGREGLEKGSRILQIAESIRKTPREEEYLDAIGAFYENWQNTDHKARALRMEKKMEEIHVRHPDDNEAAIFYALTLNSTADPADKTYANQIKAGKILEAIFRDQPNHPGIAHYIIHNYDNPELAEKALITARRYATIAPASAHAQHMPSHIFTRLGLWDESIQSNLNSVSSAQCYAEGAGIGGHWDEELHGMDYLVYGYLQKGDNKRAIEQKEYLESIREVYPVNFKDAYALMAIPSRIALENRDWKSAADLKPPALAFPWQGFPWQESILHFTRALGAAHLKDTRKAEAEIAELISLHQALIADDKTYEANQVMIQIKASQAWLSLADGSRDDAVRMMQESASMEDSTEKHPVTPCEVLPARELLGDLLLAVGRPSEALEAYERDLMGHPNRFNGLYGAAIAARDSHESQKARMYFEKLLALIEPAEVGRPEIGEARAYLKQNVQPD